ncbi:MAG: TonB-dependent receptor plug domain-containing protein [Solirubrobacterales bacterium]|jgi:iron complex outermembrane receptor protein
MAVLVSLATHRAFSQEVAPETLGDLTLEQLVAVQLVSAPSKRPQHAKEAPAVVTIVSADEIRRQGYRTLGDVLRALPGFYVTYDRTSSYLGVRGFGLPGDYNTRILFLLNGVRTNDNIYDAFAVAREFVLSPDLIERVEVSRGPGASIYGNSAFFAVVNVITKRGREVDGLQLSAAAGSFGTYEGEATFGRRLASGLEIVASGAFLDSAGQTLSYPEFAATDQGVVRSADGEQAVKAFAALGFGGFSLQAAYINRRKDVPTAPFGSIFGDPRANTRASGLLVSADYQAAIGSRLTLTTRLMLSGLDLHSEYPFQTGPAQTAVYENVASGRWWGAEATGTLRAGRHTLLGGGDFQQSSRQDQYDRFLGSPNLQSDIHGQDQRIGLYAQDDVKLGENVLLSLGARYDHYQDLGDQLNPRLALIVSPNAATTVKLLYGRAYRAPNEYEEHYYPATSGDLKAETIDTLEAAVERAIGPNARIIGSVYSSEIRQLITLDATADGVLFFRNTDRVSSVGGELALEMRARRGAAGRLSYSLQRTRNESGALSPNSPRHMLKANASVPVFGKRLWAGADAQYMSCRMTRAGAETGGFVLANVAVLARRLPGGFEATLGLYNLFDTRYADPASAAYVQAVIPQDGRNVRLHFTRRF